MLYSIDIYGEEDVPNLGVAGEFATEAEALNWAYYYMGAWHAPKAQLWRRRVPEGEDEGDRDPADLVAEISSGGYEKNFGWVQIRGINAHIVPTLVHRDRVWDGVRPVKTQYFRGRMA